MSYNTKQKEYILEIIYQQAGKFTAKDIYNILDKNVGLTTVYRVINSLVECKVIKRSIDDNNSTYYQYLRHCDSNNHFYLKCDNCGSLIHVDCSCISELKNHINKEHDFIFKNDIFINGICKKCREDCKTRRAPPPPPGQPHAPCCCYCPRQTCQMYSED